MPNTRRERVTARLRRNNRLPKRRCANDNRIFQPKLKIQRFCSDACRKQYHRYGSSYGPLKTGLEKAIQKKLDQIEAGIEFRIRAELGKHSQYYRIQQLEADTKNLRFIIEGLLTRLERIE